MEWYGQVAVQNQLIGNSWAYHMASVGS